MQEGLYVFQGVAGSSPDVRPGAHVAEDGDYTIFVELTVDPRKVTEACGRKRLHLVVRVIEQGEVKLLRLLPVAVAVQRASDHRIRDPDDVVAVESPPHIGGRCRRRVVKGAVLVAHDQHL
jgi:hypothetical protein